MAILILRSLHIDSYVQSLDPNFVKGVINLDNFLKKKEFNHLLFEELYRIAVYPDFE